MSATRFCVIYPAILFFVSLSLCSPVWADIEGNSRQQLFETDKAEALATFDKTQQQACIKAFNSRYQSKYTLNSALAFDERLSQGAYDRLFWKGSGNYHRGLIFTAYVTDWSGHKPGNLVCYYATTDNRLDFQSAYVLPALPKEEAPIVSMLDESLITLSSRQ